MADITDKAGLVIVANHWHASGGADRETLEPAQVRARQAMRPPSQAITSADQAMRTPSPAVTSADYEALARATPGLRIARAKAFALKASDLTDASSLKCAQASVTVIVVPYSASPKPIPSAGFCKTVLRHLESHRLITTRIHVSAPYYIGVSIKANVYLSPRASEAGIRPQIEKALKKFLDPLEGGPDGEGWPFGRSVFQSEIYQTIEKVPGVDYVYDIQLTAKDGSSSQPPGQVKETEIEIPLHGLVYLDLSSLSLQIFPADPRRTVQGGIA